MGHILEDHKEYAVVARLTELLNTTPKTIYVDTLSYAVFSSIITWTAQRVRSEKYQDLADQLSKEGLPNWTKEVVQHHGDEQITNLFDLLTKIRNAIAHGDDRRVSAINEAEKLVGFEFLLTASAAPYVPIARIALRTADMQALGDLFGSCFCDHLRRINDHESEEHFMLAVGGLLPEAA